MIAIMIHVYCQYMSFICYYVYVLLLRVLFQGGYDFMGDTDGWPKPELNRWWEKAPTLMHAMRTPNLPTKHIPTNIV